MPPDGRLVKGNVDTPAMNPARLCTRIGVPCTSLIEILLEVFGEVINKHLVLHQGTLSALWIPLRDLDSLPTVGHVLTRVIRLKV